MELNRKEPRTDISRRFIKFLNENGTEVTIEWDSLFDGKWKYGDQETVIIDRRKNHDV